VSRMVTTVFTVLPPPDARAMFASRLNLSGHGLAPVASTFDPHDRSTTLTQNRTFQAGPTEGRAFFFDLIYTPVLCRDLRPGLSCFLGRSRMTHRGFPRALRLMVLFSESTLIK
jgi:hypothetical protein